MNLEGRRESTNVEDRRGMSGGAMAGIGLGGGAIILALIVMLLGGDPTAVLQQAGTTTQTEQTNVEFTQEEQELASFAKKILAGTEDVWTAQFAKYGYEYQPPKMVLYTGATSSGCGAASSSVGPFYCSADQTVYLDLSFFGLRIAAADTANQGGREVAYRRLTDFGKICDLAALVRQHPPFIHLYKIFISGGRRESYRRGDFSCSRR